jgi:beta-phosphoglucomutase-like phosphatase (HAD superfamily)
MPAAQDTDMMLDLPSANNRWARRNFRAHCSGHGMPEAALIRSPPALVTSQDVTIGKLHPQCYELAARKSDVNI